MKHQRTSRIQIKFFEIFAMFENFVILNSSFYEKNIKMYFKKSRKMI